MFGLGGMFHPETFIDSFFNGRKGIVDGSKDRLESNAWSFLNAIADPTSGINADESKQTQAKTESTEQSEVES
jgi:hypothetical protein